MNKIVQWCVFVYFENGVGGEPFYFKNYKEARLYANSLVKGNYDIELEEIKSE